MRHRVNHSQFDREREQLERDYQRGVLNTSEFNRAMRDLDVSERDATREAADHNADEAYRETMERW